MFTSKRNRWLSLLIAASLILTGLLPVSVSADRDRKPVVVSFGQPNIWSLEQAHYLLARMHMTNLELQAKALTDSDLDPNATHGTRIQILKQLLDISGSYDQGIGFQNQRIVETARFNDERRRNLTTNRDRLRADSLRLEVEKNELIRERKRITDETSERAKDLDAQIEEKTRNQEKIDKEVAFQNDEIQKLGAEPSGTPTSPATPPAFDKNRLPSSVLDNLTKDELNKLLDPGRDPRLNATTMLDNTVQLQYEIIAKQLTLLRDEVGPGERLVFLELPQSIYTTPDSGDEKMAQVWWHVNGYTRTEPLVRLLLELYEVEWKWARIQLVPAFVDVSPKLETLSCVPVSTDEQKQEMKDKMEKLVGTDKTQFAEMYHQFKCERATARERVLRNIFKEASSDFDRVEQGGARDTSRIIEDIAKVIGTEAKAPKQPKGAIDRSSVSAKDLRTPETIRELRDRLLNLLSDAKPKIDGSKKPEFTFDQGIEYVPLDKVPDRTRVTAQASSSQSPNAAASPGPSPTTLAEIERRAVRTVDIIPRQSSLNVNDVQETVKATGILAAFKFLFGFAGQVNFQRQREQFEQFVHQELYASGFGKGNRDFGWTFGAVPGTKRVAPGVRTTYAALIVPENAESMVLSARGCYFPRKRYQPLDFEDTGHTDWTDDDKFRRYNCGDQQTYVLTIPGGGNTSSFWVTNVDYQAGQKAGDFVTVSVRGNNFSSQMGVLVDGVPLFTTVGLAQPHLMPIKKSGSNAAPGSVASDCMGATGICGRFERIDQEQIVFSFKMPTGYPGGTPTITLIGPGKSVDLNPLPNITINGKQNNTLQGAPFMFGARPVEGFSIKDLQLFNLPSGLSQALLIGTKFAATDKIYANGVSVRNKNLVSPNLYELTFPVSGGETVTVTIVQGTTVLSKTIPNPATLKVVIPTVTFYQPAVKNKPAVLIVKLEGVRPTVRVSKITGAKLARPPVVSASGITLRLLNPEPPVAIQLEDSVTGATTVAVVDTLPAVPAQEEPKPKPKKE